MNECKALKKIQKEETGAKSISFKSSFIHRKVFKSVQGKRLISI